MPHKVHVCLCNLQVPWELTFLCESATVDCWKDYAMSVVEVDASSQGIQTLYRKRMQQHGTFGEMTKPTNSAKYLLIEQPTVCSNFHSASVPPTWLQKKRASSSISTRMGSCSERHSRYITSSHPSGFFRKAYLRCQGQNSRCTLGATLG